MPRRTFGFPSDVSATLRFPSSVLSAEETTPSEVHAQSLSFAGKDIVTQFGAGEVKTIRVVLTGNLGIAGIKGTGLSFRLNQNYPNPFNGQTRVTFELGTRAGVTLTVVDILGRKVRELFRGYQSAGTHEETWMGTDASGRPVASGVYFAVFEARDASGSVIRQTRPMVYLK